MHIYPYLLKVYEILLFNSFLAAIDVGSGRGDFGSGDGNDDMKVGAAGALSTLQYRAREF